MKLNHLNLTVTDVKATADFLARYFNMRIGHTRGNAMAFLFDDSGFMLALMKGKEVAYPDNFHIGFIQPSEERVNEINQRMREDGVEVDQPKRTHSWTFYVKAPGGFLIEVLH